MSGTRNGASARGSAARRLADGLALAASPVFATMALLTGLPGDHPSAMCSAAHGSPFDGMSLMYLLMSAFHAGPWLKRIGEPRQ